MKWRAVVSGNVHTAGVRYYVVMYLLFVRKWILNAARNFSFVLKLPISIIVENLFII